MENIKLGNIDEAGASINNVEAALKRVDIPLRENATTFREMDDVLADVAAKWSTFDDITRASITQALAGTRQANILIALLDNWTMAQKLLGEEMDSTGLAMQRYKIYQDSLEASTNRFRAAWEKLATDTIKSEAINTFISLGTTILKVADSVGILTTALIGLAVYMNKKLITTGILKFLSLLTLSFAETTTAAGVAAYAVGGFTISVTALQAVLGVTAFLALIGVIFAVSNAINKSRKSIIDFRDEFKKTSDEIVGNVAEIEGLQNRYRQLAEQTEKSNEDLLELSDIVSTLNTKYGMITENIDLYTIAMSDNNDEKERVIRLLEELKIAEAERFIKENEIAAERAKQYLETPTKVQIRLPEYLEEIKGTPEEILEQLREKKELEKDAYGIYHEKYQEVLLELSAQQDILNIQKSNLSILDDIKYGTQYVYEKISQIVNTSKGLGEIKFVESLTGLSSELSTLQGIYKSYLETQELSTEQILQIIETYPNYLELLTIENGKIVLNTYALQAMALTRIDDMIATAEASRKTGVYNAVLEKQILILKALRQQTLNSFSDIKKAAEESVSKAAEDRTAEILKKAAEIQEQGYQDLLKMTISMLRQKKEAEKEALQAQLNAYKDIIDAAKELLDLKEKEREYDKAKAEKNKEISNIENELMELQFDTSEEGTARRLQLEDELNGKKEELGELEHDRSIELQKDALDQEYDDYKDAMDAKITALEKYLQQSGAITQDAIRLLSEKSSSFYQSLIEWNRQFGSGIDQDVVGAWNRAFNAAYAYAEAVKAIGAGITPGITTPRYNLPPGSDQGNLTGKRIKLDSATGTSVMGYMTSEGRNVEDFLKEGRYYVVKEYKAGALAPYRITGLDEDQNPVDTWIKSRDINFSTYHKGLEAGFVGGVNSNEQFAKLLKGEMVINPKQMANYMRDIFPKSVSLAAQEMGGIQIGKVMEIIVNGTLDQSVIPDIKNIANQTLEQINKLFRQRGSVRNANQYSI